MTLGHVQVFWSDSDCTIDATSLNRKLDLKSSSLYGSESLDRFSVSQLCQVMDTPGLLARPDEERNEMEALTLAAMQHLPTAVLFVMDLSGQAGDKCSSISDQFQLRREIRKRFPSRPWVDVVSKWDLGVSDDVLVELEDEILQNNALYIKLSIHDGTGVDELKNAVLKMLGKVRLVINALDAVDNQAKQNKLQD
jgi:nucleolar GTP-binding protein